MMGFAIAALIVATLGLLFWLAAAAAEGSIQAMVAAIVLVIVILGGVFNIALKEDEKGPCHQYETRFMYNAATKTMMPSRVCVLRGEWVEEDHDNK